MNRNLSIVILAVLIVFCMVTVGFVGMGFINESSYTKYDGLQMNIYDFGGAASNTIKFFTDLGDKFQQMLNESSLIPKPMTFYKITFTENVTIPTTETRTVEIIIYGYKGETINQMINHQWAYYRAYAFKEEGTKLNSYFNNLGYKMLELRSWVQNGSCLASKLTGDNKNNIFVYINENIPLPVTIGLNDNESTYTYVSIEEITTINTEEYTMVQAY